MKKIVGLFRKNSKNKSGEQAPVLQEHAGPALIGQTPSEPIDKVAIYTGGLLLIAILVICYVAAEIILPICIAFILNLVLRPVVRTMHKLRIPPGLTALIIILSLLAGVGGLGAMLSGPATDWGNKLPTALPKLEQRLQFLIKPVTAIQTKVSQAENATIGGGSKEVVAVKGDGLSDRLFSSTRLLIGGILETLLVLFFLLISGDTFQQRFIEILPKIQDKRKALQISRQIERDISAYLRTITLMNALVGLATALIMMVCGVGDPILWGTAAFFLNYVPILGPMTAACIILMAGMLTSPNLQGAIIPALLYFGVHILEGEVVTPLILSKRFTLNPALVILVLIIWFWIWGVVGAILATPMLAILKIICDRTTQLRPLGHFIEG